MKYSIILPLLLIASSTFGQNRHLSIGYKDNGICFGNSKSYNGFRLNLFDQNVDQVNGINISLSNRSSITNGISVGIISSDSLVNGVSFEGFLAYSKKINGIALGAMLGNLKINGLGLAFARIGGDTLNGLFCSMFGADWGEIKKINGISLGIFVGSVSQQFNGFTFGLFYNKSNIQRGVAIAAFNTTSELHGFQFGLLNHAGNNRKIFQWMPLINFNLRKKARN